MCSGAVPLLVMVTVCALLVDPTAVFGNGFGVLMLTAGWVPVPVRNTFCGLVRGVIVEAERRGAHYRAGRCVGDDGGATGGRVDNGAGAAGAGRGHREVVRVRGDRQPGQVSGAPPVLVRVNVFA